ncbi:MAG: Fe-S cluster assembly protein SufD [Bacteroidetes bacterium]|nr:Fe-S cluster assembly protein SufD [Bacteroidota bacterium]MBS1539918.1 Fe-S cluster assembly protein SufD [Bacteroidota bacterium]
MEGTATEKDFVKEITSAFSSSKLNVAPEKRQQALQYFQQFGLPDKKNEEYRFTPIATALEKKFTWPVKTVDSPINSIQSFLIDGLDAYVIVLINGKFSPEHSNIHQPETGLTIKTLSDAWQSEKQTIEKHWDKYINIENDAYASLNSACWQEGVFVRVEENKKIEKPIFILHVHDASVSQVVAHTKALVIAEAGSELSLIEKSGSIGKENIFHTFGEEIVVGSNASLNYIKIQQDEGNLYQVATSAIYQADSSQLNTFTLTLNGKMIRNNFNIAIDGENCESHFYGLYLLSGDTLADNHTVVDHRKPRSFSNELYKGVMDNNSKAIFNGKIYVRPQAQKTNAFQSNRNILLTDTATVNTKPQLEIWADDVKCSHGCTTGQLDEEALFYLRSRGIPEATAKAMLLYAFAAETLAPIKNESLKKYLDALISDRLHKDF